MSTNNNYENIKIKFQGKTKDVFLEQVRKRVDEYFNTSHNTRNASTLLHIKGVALISSMLLIYLSLLFGWVSFIPRFILWTLLGLNKAFIAVNIGHDSLHGSYSNSPRINRLLGFLSYDFIGLSSYVWKQTHNRGHHTFTNISGADPDINKPGLLRLSPHDPHYKIHKYQQWYIWLLYTVVGLNWVLYSDYAHVWEDRMKIPRSELVPFFFFKAVNLSYMLVIPLLFFPMSLTQIAIGYLCCMLAGGYTVAVIFQLAHIVEGLEFPLPDEKGIINKAWGEHEMETTANFATHNPFVTHLIGGLNFQVEHHLFPKVSHGHYIAISKIVRKTAREYNLPYHENPTVLSALISHARFLKKLGAITCNSLSKELHQQ